MIEAQPRAAVPASTTRDILAQAWPMFVAQLAFIANFTIDTAMAGRLSAVELAGVSLGTNLYVTIAIGMMGVISALLPVAAHHYGAGRTEQIGRDVHEALWLAALLSVPGCAALIWHGTWIDWAQPSPDVAQVASRYLAAAAFGLPAALATRVFVALNSALSRPHFTMAINLTALLLKIPLNALFIWGAGPIEAHGGAGCAIATACQSWITLTLALAAWRWHPSFRAFHRALAPARRLPQWERQKELLRIGAPAGLATLFEVTSFTLMAVLMTRLGAATLSGHTIVANVVSILFMLPLSVGLAAGALVAQSLGSGMARQAQRLSGRAVRFTTAVALVLALGTWLARAPLIGAYTTDPQIAEAAGRLIGLAAAFHVFDALQGVSVFVLRGYKVTFWPMLIYGVSLWGIGLGGGYVLAYRGIGPLAPMGSVGLWTAALSGLAAAAACLLWLTRYVARAHARDELPRVAPA